MPTVPEFPESVPQTLAAIFAIAAAVNLGGFGPLRALLSRWEYPRGFHRILGMFSLLAALFLALPETRIWGVALAAFLLFGATISLLNHSRYLAATISILLLTSLPTALIAGA
jgi:hypothetical protein